MIRLCALLLVQLAWIPSLPAQGEASERLSRRDAAALTERIADLLEATRIVMPELNRAGAPLAENFRQGAKTLELTANSSHTGILYTMLANAKAYLQLSDTLPKPADFSEDISRQLGELRGGIQRFDAHFRALLHDREFQVLGSDRDNLRRYAEANSLVGPVERDEVRVVFLGDSITDGWKLDQYFTGLPYLNRGISGQITGQMLGRTVQDVLALNPKAMVLLGGTNDLARGVPDATIRNNLEAIGLLAHVAGVIPVIASILPVHDYQQDTHPRYRRTSLRSPSRIASLNEWLEGLCRSNGWIYLDYHSAMVDADARLRNDLSGDGLHPNAEGYKVMAPLAQMAIDRAVRAKLRRPGSRGR